MDKLDITNECIGKLPRDKIVIELSPEERRTTFLIMYKGMQALKTKEGKDLFPEGNDIMNRIWKYK